MSVTNLVEVSNLRQFYPIRQGLLGKAVGSVKAVDGVSLTVHEKEAFGLVGESGCGKSTLGRLLLRLEEPTEGTIIYNGQDILRLEKEELRILPERIPLLFQDPYSSLNP